MCHVAGELAPCYFDGGRHVSPRFLWRESSCVTTLRGRLSTSLFRGAEAILGEDTKPSRLSVDLVRGSLASTKGGFSLVEVSDVLKRLGS